MRASSRCSKHSPPTHSRIRILRNIIAERVLGLPGGIRVDKDQSFNAQGRS
jgi:hypothetical protein